MIKMARRPAMHFEVTSLKKLSGNRSQILTGDNEQSMMYPFSATSFVIGLAIRAC